MSDYKHEFQNDGFDWFAVDERGDGFEFAEKPECSTRVWTCDGGHGSCKNVTHNYTGEWKESLQQRLTNKQDIKPSQEWKMGHIPPDGTKCEAIWEDSVDWEPVTFKRGFDSKVWFHASGNEIVVPAHTVVFRPLQSKRDKTIERGNAVLHEAINGDKTTCEALYDAGMLTLPDGEE